MHEWTGIALGAYRVPGNPGPCGPEQLAPEQQLVAPSATTSNSLPPAQVQALPIGAHGVVDRPPRFVSDDDPQADTGTDALMGLLRRWASSVSISTPFVWELGSGLVDEGVQLFDESGHAESHCGSAAGGQQRLGAVVFATLDQRSCPPVAGAGGERR